MIAALISVFLMLVVGSFFRGLLDKGMNKAEEKMAELPPLKDRPGARLGITLLGLLVLLVVFCVIIGFLGAVL